MTRMMMAIRNYSVCTYGTDKRLTIILRVQTPAN